MAGLMSFLAFLIFTPRKDSISRLWHMRLDAIEYNAPSGKVRLEKDAGWFVDRFYITTLVNGSPLRRPASPAVKGIFADLEAPVVKGEYILSDEQIEKRFENENCLTLYSGGDKSTICGGEKSNGLTPVRLPNEANRIYMLPEYIFSRLATDPQAYIEKRLVILPAGTVPDRLRITAADTVLELCRKKDGPEGAVRWYKRQPNSEDKPIAEPQVTNLLSSLYNLQRDVLLTPGQTDSSVLQNTVQYEIEIDVVLEGPAAGGPLQRFFGDQTIRLSLRGREPGPFRATANGFTDGVNLERVNRFTEQFNALAAQ